MDWNPTETAPKDGTRVLVWSDTFGGRAIGARWDADKYAVRPRPYWSTDDERLCGITACRQNPPSRWMPLPAKPTN